LNRRALIVLALVLAVPSRALADDDKSACLAEHEAGQLSRRAGHFDNAREQFASCTADACPPPVQKRCVAFLAELDAAQPTVVIAVRDLDGHDVVHGVSMTLDGGSPREVPATALRLDPGEHSLRIVRGTSPPSERSFILREGEKDRRVELVLEREGAAVPAAEPRGHKVGTSSRVLFGVSGVAILGAISTSAAGWAVRGHLESACQPRCTASQVEPLRVLWPTSFTLLGVGVVSGAIALTLVLTKPASSPDRPTWTSGFHASANGVGWVF
jgi:hypothetical protein